MESISQNTTVFLDSYIDINLFEAFGSRACYCLFVKNNSNIDYVYKTLKHNVSGIDVYKRDEVPDHLRYKNNIRLGDLIIVTHIGHAVYINNQTVDWTTNSNFYLQEIIRQIFPTFCLEIILFAEIKPVYFLARPNDNSFEISFVFLNEKS
jgi:hypothetical protein